MFFTFLAVLPLLIAALRLLGPVSSHTNELLKPNLNDAVPRAISPPKVLLLTAHPDDECFFFTPTILSLLNTPDGVQKPKIFSLCLSTGNADGLGELRREELSRSLDILGIEREKSWVLDNPKLQDNFTAIWEAEVIAEVVKPFVLENHITTVLTFDRKGVSSHPNHLSIPSGVAHLISSWSPSAQDSNQPPPRLFTLITVPVLTKYSGLLSALLARVNIVVHSPQWAVSYFRTPLTAESQSPSSSHIEPQAIVHPIPVYISGASEYLIGARAIIAHDSQLVWFRYLYLIFSRYMWVNEWIEFYP